MKFISEQTQLLKAINSVINGISSKRDTILEGILIQTLDNSIKFNTYNEEIGIEYTIFAFIVYSNIVEKGSTVIKAHTFAEIIRRLPDTDINITLDKENNLLTIECEGSCYKLSTLRPEDFPEIPQVQIENSIEISQKDLKNIIKQTIFAVGTDEKRKLYTGSLFDVDNTTLNVVSIDGYRLAIRKTEVISDSSFKMVIPGKTLTEISKIINDSFDMVKIGFSNNQGIFEFENGKLTTKLLEGEFLNYKDIIKTPTETRIKVNRNAITESFDRVMLISASSLVKEKKEPVDIQVEIDKLTISCTSSVGMANEEIFTQTEGKEVKLKFNPKFFMDVLKNISNEEIIIDFGTSKSPTMIKPIEDNGEFNYIILPIKSREN